MPLFIRQQNPLANSIKKWGKKSIKKREKILLKIIHLCATTPIKLIDYNYDYECIIDSGWRLEWLI